ncbi:hypothetical protein ACQKHB_23060 [Escherichia coli]|uniref:hypothetical protein n=1 Tax=Escherichia coli TaxID=562 RepID=UPI003D069DC1
MAMTIREFHNGLRVLLNLDMHELESAGVLDSPAEWDKFTGDPYRYFIRANDDKANRLWNLMQRRMTGRTPPI